MESKSTKSSTSSKVVGMAEQLQLAVEFNLLISKRVQFAVVF